MPALDKCLTIEDLKGLARRRVPKMFFDYADSGSWTETTYRENESDFQKIKLRQRIAVNMQDRSLETDMLGIPVAMPVALAPTGLTGMQFADGEILAAKAAEKSGVPFTLSTMSICSIEDVAENTKTPFWFQLYVMRDRGFVEGLVDRAKAAKCSALVLTMDLQILGQRHKDIRNGLSAPPKFTLAHVWQVATRPRWALGILGTERRTFRNLVGHVRSADDLSQLAAWTNSQFDPTLCWEDVGWVKERFGEAGSRAWRRRRHRLQPWRTAAGRRALVDQGPAGDRGRRRRPSGGLSRRGNPLGTGHPESARARRQIDFHRPRVPLRARRRRGGRREPRARYSTPRA
jgi:L-lactate dehydrogenase (cytochrome)